MVKFNIVIVKLSIIKNKIVLKKEERNHDLIKIRFIKVRLKRKMIGINERSAPQILWI